MELEVRERPLGRSFKLSGELLLIASQYIERVLAFSFISNRYLLTAHQEHLSVYDLSKVYPLFNLFDPSTEPVPLYQLVLPEICHAAGFHHSGSLDHIPSFPPVSPPPDPADDEETAWGNKEVPFYEDPSRNILAINLIHYVGHWQRVTGTVGTTIIIPLQRLVDFAEETLARSAADIIGKTVNHTEVHAEARDGIGAQMYPELGRAQPLGTPHQYPISKLAQLERRRRIELTRAGLNAATTITRDSTRIPKCFQPTRWLKHALVFDQETHGRLYDYRRSIVSGSRFVSSVEVRERKRLFQLIEFNPTWVNALEQRLGRPAREVGIHYKAVWCGNPIIRFVEWNWQTEGLIIPMTFGEHVAANNNPDDGFPEINFGSDDGGYAFPPPPSPVTPAPTTPIKSETDRQLAEIDSSQPSWHGWRVARCGEVKYAWKMIQTSRDMVALDVGIQEDSLIYTAVGACVCVLLYKALICWTGRGLFLGSSCVLRDQLVLRHSGRLIVLPGSLLGFVYIFSFLLNMHLLCPHLIMWICHPRNPHPSDSPKGFVYQILDGAAITLWGLELSVLLTDNGSDRATTIR